MKDRNLKKIPFIHNGATKRHKNGNNINVMTQTPGPKPLHNLPSGLCGTQYTTLPNFVLIGPTILQNTSYNMTSCPKLTILRNTSYMTSCKTVCRTEIRNNMHPTRSLCDILFKSYSSKIDFMFLVTLTLSFFVL